MSFSADVSGSRPGAFRSRFALLWLLLIVLVLAVYWPGLQGTFIHDDYSSIVDNPDIRVDTLQDQDWSRAAQSFPAGGRWLAMLSFAANFFFSGLSPFAFKLTNLGIHLVNGGLLYLCLCVVFRLWARQRGNDEFSPRLRGCALGITACWLLLPVQLTAVLYVVQRMESLSTTFIFLGLWLYLRTRLRWGASAKGLLLSASFLGLATFAGLLVKENAVMLPLYAFCVEWALGSFSDPAQRKRVGALYGAMLGAPLLLGCVWLLTWRGLNFFGRQFGIVERVMTEWRILADYIVWSLLPMPRSLSLYHDTIGISTGLLHPVTTLLSLMLLLAMGAVALWQRKTRPLFALGIAWFFAGQVMTATILPLELVYEHRNYFASAGLLLSVAALALLEPIARLQPRAVAVIAGAMLAFYAFNTSLRAIEWGNPVRLAYSEALKNPDSPRALYELGRSLSAVAAATKELPPLEKARDAFLQCLSLPRPGGLCAQGLIVLAPRLGQQPDPAWWAQLTAYLKSNEPTQSDLSALESLMHCMEAEVCVRQPDELGGAFDAARSHEPVTARLGLTYSDFLLDLRDDLPASESVLRELIARFPAMPEARANLIVLLLHTHRVAEAEAQLGRLHGLDRMGSLAPMLKDLDARLQRAKSTAP